MEIIKISQSQYSIQNAKNTASQKDNLFFGVKSSIGGNTVPQEGVMYKFKNTQDIQDTIDSDILTFQIYLDTIQSIAPQIVTDNQDEWKEYCNKINVPYDDNTNFAVVEIKDAINMTDAMIEGRINAMNTSQIKYETKRGEKIGLSLKDWIAKKPISNKVSKYSIKVKMNDGKDTSTITETFKISKKLFRESIIITNFGQLYNEGLKDNNTKKSITNFMTKSNGYMTLPAKVMKNVTKTAWGYELADTSNYKLNPELITNRNTYNAYNQCPSCEDDTYFLYEVEDFIGFDMGVCDECNYSSLVI